MEGISIIPCPHCNTPLPVAVQDKMYRGSCSHCHATLLIFIITVGKPQAEKLLTKNVAKNDNAKYKLVEVK